MWIFPLTFYSHFSASWHFSSLCLHLSFVTLPILPFLVVQTRLLSILPFHVCNQTTSLHQSFSVSDLVLNAEDSGSLISTYKIHLLYGIVVSAGLKVSDFWLFLHGSLQPLSSNPHPRSFSTYQATFSKNHPCLLLPPGFLFALAVQAIQAL
jgi:hypothetical protein